MKLLVSYLLIFLVCVSSAYGGSYYVAQNSNGKGDGSSYTNRMSVIGHNNSRFNGGDLIYLCGKIKSQLVVPSSGTSGNPIFYRGYEFDPAVFNGELEGQFLGIGKNHISIDQIEFDGSGNEGTAGIVFSSNCHYITITRCKFHDMISNYSKKKNVAIFFNNGNSSERNSHITIGGSRGMGNVIYNIGVDTGDSDVILSYTDDVIFSHNKNYGNPDRTSGIDGLTILSSKRFLIENNQFYEHNKYMSGSGLYHQSDHGEDGIDLKGVTDAIIRYNVIHSNRSVGINVNRDDPVSADCNNILIYNNLIYDCGVNIRFAGSYDDERHSNLHVWGNIVHSAKGTQNLASSTNGENFYIYNNTFYNPISSDRFQITASQNNFNIKNNIFMRDNSRRQLYLNGTSTSFNVDGNLYYYFNLSSQTQEDGVWQASTSVDKNGIDADPRFLNVKEHNFRLADDSPAKDSGVAISGSPPSITIFGKTYNPSYAEVLSPTTDWSDFPPTVNSVYQNNDSNGWVRGAYAFSNVNSLHSPKNVIVLGVNNVN